eukprot:COSAG01_NODE_33179_length_568_cov_6.893390_2_plen_33_part_01
MDRFQDGNARLTARLSTMAAVATSTATFFHQSL